MWRPIVPDREKGLHSASCCRFRKRASLSIRRCAMNERHDRILVVDDEPQIRRFLRTSLAAHGYDVLEAATGAEALRMASAERPDLMVLDLGLPDADGIEVLKG